MALCERMTPEERWEELSRLEGARRPEQATKDAAVEYVDMPNDPCPKCGSTKRTFLGQRQERAMDEAGTTYYGCDNGHVVRF